MVQALELRLITRRWLVLSLSRRDWAAITVAAALLTRPPLPSLPTTSPSPPASGARPSPRSFTTIPTSLVNMGSAPSKQVEAGAQEKLAEALRAMELRNERDLVEKDYVYVQDEARQ